MSDEKGNRAWGAINEYLEMTPAQRVSASDQIHAKVKHEFPEAERSLNATAELLEALGDLVFEAPDTALSIMSSVEEVFEVLRVVSQQENPYG